jgi:hypothetical protein
MGEDMEKSKKKWVKPVLIVIGRSQPQEKVLAACKTNGPTEQKPTCAGSLSTDCQHVSR